MDWDFCQSCDPCSARLTCKTRAIVKIDRGDPALIDLNQCNGCGDCLLACSFEAISLRDPSTPSSKSRQDPTAQL